MLPKAYLTSHSRMSGSRWVIAPLWVSESWRAFLFSSSVYSCHLFLVSSASVQFSSVTQLCPTLCDPMNCSTPGLPVHHQLLEFTQTHVHRVGDACHPAISSSVIRFSSCPQSFPASGSFLMSNSSHEVAKVLEFQLQHQSFQWTPRTDLL